MKEENEIIPYEQEKILKDEYKAARKQRDQMKIKACQDSLVSLYVLYGESYKRSDKPEPTAAKFCLEKALDLQDNHPIANYRYAHLLYGDANYAAAAFHFNKALDGNREQSLNETQSLISQMMLVNCGILIARIAIKEVCDLQNNTYSSIDSKLKDIYADRMLVESEEMLSNFLYMKMTATKHEPISEEQFYAEQDFAGDSDVLLCVTPVSRELIFRGHKETLTQTEFFIVHTVLYSENFIKVRDIHDILFQDRPLEEIVSPAAVRQCLHRLSRDIPFWEIIVESDIRGNYSARRRRKGINYTFLYHCSVVLP